MNWESKRKGIIHKGHLEEAGLSLACRNTLFFGHARADHYRETEKMATCLKCRLKVVNQEKP